MEAIDFHSIPQNILFCAQQKKKLIHDDKI